MQGNTNAVGKLAGNTNGRGNKGKKRTAEQRSAISAAQIGRTHSDETRKKMSESQKKRWASGMRKPRAGHPWDRVTKLEQRVHDVLSGMGVTFVVHPLVVIDGRWLRPDLYLPSYNLYIEINGCYWHGCSCKKKSLKKQSEKDIKRYAAMEGSGMNLRVIWEHDIEDNIVNAITKSIRDQQ